MINSCSAWSLLYFICSREVRTAVSFCLFGFQTLVSTLYLAGSAPSGSTTLVRMFTLANFSFTEGVVT